MYKEEEEATGPGRIRVRVMTDGLGGVGAVIDVDRKLPVSDDV